MPVAWFVVPYVVSDAGESKYLALNDLAGIDQWSEAELRGNHAVAKVKASAAKLTELNGLSGWTRLLKDTLDSSLSDLTGPQKTALRNKLVALGHTSGEITAALGADIGQRTLGDVFRWASGVKGNRPVDHADVRVV